MIIWSGDTVMKPEIFRQSLACFYIVGDNGILSDINHIYRNTLFAVEYYKLVYISIRYCSENIDTEK